MGLVLLVEGVAVMRLRRRLAQAAPASGEGRGHRAVAALGSRVVARVDRCSISPATPCTPRTRPWWRPQRCAHGPGRTPEAQRHAFPGLPRPRQDLEHQRRLARHQQPLHGGRRAAPGAVRICRSPGWNRQPRRSRPRTVRGGDHQATDRWHWNLRSSLWIWRIRRSWRCRRWRCRRWRIRGSRTCCGSLCRRRHISGGPEAGSRRHGQ